MYVVICVQPVFFPSGANKQKIKIKIKKRHLHMARPNDNYGSSEFYNV